MAKKNKDNYKTLGEEEYYKMGKGRGVVRVSEDKENKNRTVLISKEVLNKNNSWTVRKGFGISLRWIDKVIDILLRFARKFGWEVKELKKPEDQIKELKESLNAALEQKGATESIRKNLENEIRKYKEDIEKLRINILQSNFESFRKDLVSFEELLNKTETQSVNEEELQKFLKANPWIFSPEYINITPKKPVGSKSIFDFYLEDYKGQGTVVELEKPSDDIFSRNEKFGISQKCGESLGQLIRYTEDTISYSQNKRVSEKENIEEDKPLGFLIIGRTKSKESIQTLKVINYYIHSIQILSYDLLLLRAKKMIEGFGRTKNKIKAGVKNE